MNISKEKGDPFKAWRGLFIRELMIGSSGSIVLIVGLARGGQWQVPSGPLSQNCGSAMSSSP